MDFGFLGVVEFTPQFFAQVLQITLIDLVLAGDNAVVIALAVQNLQGKQRKLGIIFGAGGAVLIRVIATFVCAQLLQLQFVKLVGGAVIIWIAFKLMIMQAEGGEETHGKTAGNLWQALWIIIVADMSMAIDNMLAVGGACHGNLFLLLFGLVLSIPLVVCGAGLLSMLMGKYPIIVWIGAAILGKVGGEMMITDPWIEGLLHPSKAVEWGVMIFFTAAVIVGSKLLLNKKKAAKAGEAAPAAAPAD